MSAHTRAGDLLRIAEPPTRARRAPAQLQPRAGNIVTELHFFTPFSRNAITFVAARRGLYVIYIASLVSCRGCVARH